MNNIHFDLGAISKSTVVFVKKSKNIVPTNKEIESFIQDVKRGLVEIKNPLNYGRIIILCDWRDEEDDVPEEIEKKIGLSEFELGRGVGGGKNIISVQLIIDYGKMYSMFPLVPDSFVDG